MKQTRRQWINAFACQLIFLAGITTADHAAAAVSIYVYESANGFGARIEENASLAEARKIAQAACMKPGNICVEAASCADGGYASVSYKSSPITIAGVCGFATQSAADQAAAKCGSGCSQGDQFFDATSPLSSAASATHCGTFDSPNSGCGATACVTNTADIRSDYDELALSDTMVGVESSEQKFRISNKGTGTLHISSISVTGDFIRTAKGSSLTGPGGNCPLPAGTPISLEPGAYCDVGVSFSPHSVGELRGKVIIASDAANHPTLELGLIGKGLSKSPVATLSTSLLDFGKQTIYSTSAEKEARLTNDGNADLTISSVSPAPDGYEKRNASTCGDGTVLSPGANCTVKVVFAPSKSGRITGEIRIATNAPGSPHKIVLDGTGDAAAVSASPNALNFGEKVAASASTSQTVTLKNAGSGTVMIDAIAISGEFEGSHNCGSYLYSGTTCQVKVVFHPQTAGAKNGTLTVRSSALAEPLSVALKGSGVSADTCLATFDTGSGRLVVPYLSYGGKMAFKITLVQDTRYDQFVTRPESMERINAVPEGCAAATIYDNLDLSIPSIKIGGELYVGPFNFYLQNRGSNDNLFVNSIAIQPGRPDAALRPEVVARFRGDTVLILAEKWKCAGFGEQTLGAGMVSSECKQDAGQRFLIEDSQIKVYEAGLCLDGNVGKGQAAKLAACNNSVSQKWYFHAGGQIQNQAGNGYCLDVKDAKTDNGTPVILWDCTNENESSKPWNHLFTRKAATEFDNPENVTPLGKYEYCFGAVGQGCAGGGFQWPNGSYETGTIHAGCGSANAQGQRNCWVAPGSIRHDNCCTRHPDGWFCQQIYQGNTNCSPEWDLAQRDVLWGYTWQETFDASTPASLHKVPSSRYPKGGLGDEGETTASKRLCAPGGTELDSKDVEFCCSKSWRSPPTVASNSGQNWHGFCAD